MFKGCHKCGHGGLKCQDDYASLKSGYWWQWRNETHKDRYKVYIRKLLTSSPALGEDDVQYPYPLPTSYKCPIEVSCKGGLDSPCENGYEGPLCSVCSSGYYKQFQTCLKCPTKAWIAGQLISVAVILLIIIVLSVKIKQRMGSEENSLVDSLLSKIKIAIGFYQVTLGLLEAFSYINWPDSLQVIGKYSEILQLNILQMTPLHCLSLGLQVDAFGNLFTIMAMNAAVIGLAAVAYGVRKVTITRNLYLGDDGKARKLSQTKELTYRNLFFLLYVTYLSTCSKTASVLPFACRNLPRDGKDDLFFKYLKADYSIRCDDSKYKHFVTVAYISSAYIIVLPVATFIVLWKNRRVLMHTEDVQYSTSYTETIRGLRFLFNNYKKSSWYWEMVEMSRKVIITSGLFLVGKESRSYIGLAWVVAGMYGVLFAWMKPIEDAFENKLMTTSLAVTVVNLGIGAVSRIPAESLPASINPYMDTVVFNILVFGANTLVIGLLVCKIICVKY